MKPKKSKLVQAGLLRASTQTKFALPATTAYTSQHLLTYLDKFGSVYLKPDAGLKGLGIIRVTKVRDGKFLVKYFNGRRFTFASKRQLLAVLRKSTTTKRYVIQRAIRSVTKAGRPFDIRVHVQRVRGQWVVGGIVGRLGRIGEIVTNRHRGAKPISMTQLLSSHLHMNGQQILQMKQRLGTLSLAVAKEMRKAYPNRPEFGIDIGIDRHGHLWIYEANTSPGIHVFEDLQDKTALRRIIRNRQLLKRR